MKNINLNKYLNKIASQRGNWKPPSHFGEEMLAVCQCCIDFANTGQWPGGSGYCNPGQSVDMDEHCTRRIDGSPGLGTFDYNQSGKDDVKNLLYILDHWKEPFYPASCLTDINCYWLGWDYQDQPKCCYNDGDSPRHDLICASDVPNIVCNLWNGEEMYNCNHCCDPQDPYCGQDGGEYDCKNSSDCSKGWSCKDGRCLRDCVTDADCPPDEECNDGSCFSPVGSRTKNGK